MHCHRCYPTFPRNSMRREKINIWRPKINTRGRPLSMSIRYLSSSLDHWIGPRVLIIIAFARFNCPIQTYMRNWIAHANDSATRGDMVSLTMIHTRIQKRKESTREGTWMPTKECKNYRLVVMRTNCRAVNSKYILQCNCTFNFLFTLQVINVELQIN